MWPVASKIIAVGSVVPAAQIVVDAVAPQAMAKVSYTTDGLAHLATGLSAAQTDAALTSAAGDARTARSRWSGLQTRAP